MAHHRLVQRAIGHVMVVQVELRNAHRADWSTLLQPCKEPAFACPIHDLRERVDVVRLQPVKHPPPCVEHTVRRPHRIALQRCVELMRMAVREPLDDAPCEALHLERAHARAVRQIDHGIRPVFVDLEIRLHGVGHLEAFQAAGHAGARGVLHGAEHQVRRRAFDHGGPLRPVRVADDYMQAAERFGVGVGFVARVDHRPRARRRRRHGLVHEPRTLRVRPVVAVEPAGAGVDLPCDEERQQLGLDRAQVDVSAHQIVLMATVGVAGAVGVVLEQVNRGALPRLRTQTGLRLERHRAHDRFAGGVGEHRVERRACLGGGVLGVRADVEIQA